MGTAELRRERPFAEAGVDEAIATLAYMQIPTMSPGHSGIMSLAVPT